MYAPGTSDEIMWKRIEQKFKVIHTTLDGKQINFNPEKRNKIGDFQTHNGEVASEANSSENEQTQDNILNEVSKPAVDDFVSLQPTVHHRVHMLDLLTNYNKLKRKKKRIENGDDLESTFVEQTAKGRR